MAACSKGSRSAGRNCCRWNVDEHPRSVRVEEGGAGADSSNARGAVEEAAGAQERHVRVRRVQDERRHDAVEALLAAGTAVVGRRTLGACVQDWSSGSRDDVQGIRRFECLAKGGGVGFAKRAE